MNDRHLASSYRRMFRAYTAHMANWKMGIVICIDSDDMPGATDEIRIRRAVQRMGKIKRAVEFMVGGRSMVKMYDNADTAGRTVVLRNDGYYKNVGP